MFFQKKSKKAAQANIIKVTRESVCMGDDCMAPHEEKIKVLEKDHLFDVFEKVKAYLPQMQDVIWSIDCGTYVLGYVIVEEDANYKFELCEKNQVFSLLDIEHLHCSYFHTRSFLTCLKDGEEVERYPMCHTLLDKVKCHMKGMFLERLQIKGGGLCIWGEWFGRPYDNYHSVHTIHWTKDDIRIEFDQGESLYIEHPSMIKNEKAEFVVNDATSVLWVWYSYGKEKTYENLYVCQYRKTQEGSILRAKGKRRKVSHTDGSIFVPSSEIAVCLKDYHSD